MMQFVLLVWTQRYRLDSLPENIIGLKTLKGEIDMTFMRGEKYFHIRNIRS